MFLFPDFVDFTTLPGVFWRVGKGKELKFLANMYLACSIETNCGISLKSTLTEVILGF